MFSSLDLPKVVAIIPARYQSSRLPGKPLIDILGKTLLRHTYENALRAKSLDRLIIATDDERIHHHALSFGAEVVMTSPDCLSGTERIAQVVEKMPELATFPFLINIQGDEPSVPPGVIDALVQLLHADPEVPIATPISPIHNEAEALSPHVVKCVIDKQGYALYFSRSLLPSSKSQRYDEKFPYYRHLGIYGYRTSFLSTYASLPPTPLQLREDLEQLKAMEYGYRIKTVIVEYSGLDVNTSDDINKMERFLCSQNSFL